jgi:hypothetical protein
MRLDYIALWMSLRLLGQVRDNSWEIIRLFMIPVLSVYTKTPVYRYHALPEESGYSWQMVADYRTVTLFETIANPTLFIGRHIYDLLAAKRGEHLANTISVSCMIVK